MTIQAFLDKLSVLGAEDVHLLGDHVVAKLGNGYKLYYFDDSGTHIIANAYHIKVLDAYRGYVAVGVQASPLSQPTYYIYDTNNKVRLGDTSYHDILLHNNGKFLVSVQNAKSSFYACIDKAGNLCSKFTTYLMSPLNVALNVFDFICTIHSDFKVGVYDTVTDKILTFHATSMHYIDNACIMYGVLGNEVGYLVLTDGRSTTMYRRCFVPIDDCDVMNKATDTGYFYRITAKNTLNIKTDIPINRKNTPLVLAEGNFIRQEF